MRDKYGVYHDKYCYPGCDVLINLLNLRDADELAEAEVAFTAERYRTYQSSLSSIEECTFSHLKHLHFYLFQDLFAWAGDIREVDISKGDTRFCTVPRIEVEGEKLFKLVPDLALITHRDELIDEVASLFCEMNLLHPFREGNGRVQRFFFEEMLFLLGYDLNWPVISQQQWIDANIAGVYLDLEPLKSIFRQAISELPA
ncbi:Fic/DOC family protein [Vibrio atypicus]|jgi:cell filamentation protein|uniref:Fic/DOC family protein n=1 Tax=Vibrio atypicus TaxID=558271 RepID=UPI00135784AB|nr:Fic family protein [Vibrio atypicus]